MIIYRLTSPSGHIYIGKSKFPLDVRFRQHITLWKMLSEREDPKLTKLHLAFNKYPPELWIKEILIECDELSVNDLERQQIEIHNSYKLGYNSTIGGEGIAGLTFTDKHKKGISEGRKEYFKTEAGIAWKKVLSERRKAYNATKRGIPSWNKGKKMPERSEEEKSITAAKLSAIQKGRVKSLEERQKMSETRRGMKLSDDHKRKIGLAQIGKPKSPNVSKALSKANSASWEVITPDGDILIVHNLNEYCKTIGVGQANLSRGKSKGYRARRLTEKGVKHS